MLECTTVVVVSSVFVVCVFSPCMVWSAVLLNCKDKCSVWAMISPFPYFFLPDSHPYHTQSSPSHPSSSHPPLVVKVRQCGSGESDFVEVEVVALTYQALLHACCEELELSTTDVAKIRKLPNILVRKDRDIQRMREGQELEVVIKSEAITPPSSYMTSMLTVNPFSSNTMLALQNQVQARNEAILPMSLAQSKVEENGAGGLVSGLSDSSSQLEIQAHHHSSPSINGLQ